MYDRRPHRAADASRRSSLRGIRSLAGAAGAVVAASALVLFSVVAPAHAAAPSFVEPPTRLYMAPAGSLPVSIPDGFPTVIPEGELPFDGGTDLISDDIRTIEIESGEVGCAMAAPDWNQGGCTAVQLSVSHGTLTFDPLPTQEDDGDSPFDVLKFADGALERDKYELSDLPAPSVALIGTTAQVNAALATLVYVPDTDEDDDGTADDPYYYNGSNAETLQVLLGPGDPALGNVDVGIEIRVQKINGFPEVTVPGAVVEVDPASPDPQFLSLTTPPGDDWLVEDEDNDENDGNDTLDGPGDEWLLIAWADCGQFSMRASPFTIGDDLEQLITGAIDMGLAPDPPNDTNPEYVEYLANRELVVDGIFEAIPDEVENLPFATGNPTDPTSAFAGVVSGLNALEALNYALDEVEFHAGALTDATCTVRFMVSDLGNNGLPLHYFGDQPYGIQLPFFGFDLDTNDVPTIEKVVVQVGDGTEVDVTLPTDVTIPEGGTDVVPVSISPATHPAFDLTVSTAPSPGTTPDADYTSVSGVTVSIPEDATDASIPVDALQDLLVDPGESYSVVATLPAEDPPGFTLTSSDPAALVSITDDEVAPTEVDVTLPDDGVVAEGATGTIPIAISPAVHPAFDVTVSTADGPASVGGVDFTELTDLVVTVPADATSVDVPIDALADDDLDPGETYAVMLELPAADPPGFALSSSDDLASVTITDVPPDATDLDLSMPTDATLAEGTAGTVPIVLAPAVHPAFDVTVTSAPVGATTSGADYTALSSFTISVPADAASVDVPVDALTDGVTDPGEQYTVTVTPPVTPPPGFTFVVSDPSATVTITDVPPDDIPVDVTLPEDGTVVEGTTSTIPIDVSPAEHPAFDLTVSTTDGPASVGGVDFTELTDVVVTVPADAATVDLTIDALTDSDADPGETYTVLLTLPAADPPGFALSSSDDLASVTITDVPPEPTTIDLAMPTDAAVAEGAAGTVPILVTPATHPEFAVTVSTTAVPPTSAPDFTAIAAQTFAVPADAASIDIPVDALQDLDVDPGETYTVSIDGVPASPPFPEGFDLTISDDSATVTITDDDLPPEPTEIQLALPTDASVAEGAVGAVPITVSPATHPAFDVTVSTAPVGATTSGADYTALAGVTIAIPADAASVDVTVDALADLLPDPGEQYTVTVTPPASPPAGFTIVVSDASATVTILDELVAPDPLAIQVPDDIVVDAEPGEPGANVDYPAVTTTGGVDPITIECDHASGDLYPIGVTTVTCTATDSAPPEEIVLFAVVSDSFTITVNEGEEPPPTTPPATPPGSDPGGSGAGGSGSGGTAGGATGGMASTGVDPSGWLAIAALLLLAGAVAARVARHRRAS
ncbi:HYR domain-containing protein [Agromyces sp. Marseille-Q5079]|uniref:HYR domain-containing protein n=1 Tax=Agromyces sp. Marseille-Q5079 TaxID=3439059 RepID=UPI003D9CB9CE